VLDLPGFSRFRLVGPGARAHLDRLTATRLPSPGRMGLAYFADDRGRIVTEMTAMVESDDAVGLITAAVAQSHDADLLRQGLPQGIALQDWTDRVHCLIVTGPKSRDLLADLTDADLSRPWLSVIPDAVLAGRPVTLVRVSFAGELGWEVHCTPSDAAAIWDALRTGGATPFGMFALNSLRAEKGYRAWKGDLSTDYTLLQGGLERFIDWTKDFRGKPALAAERQAGVTKRFVSLTVQAGDCDPPYMSTLWHDGQVVGETTTGVWGHRVGACIALGMLRADLTVPGTAVEVEIFGTRHPATVMPDAPLWDPLNERLRA
jgi:dimethylglycine dehydrogenase